MNLQSVPEARPPAASLVDHEDKRIAKAAQKVLAAEAALDAAWEAGAAKAALRAKRDKLKKQLAEIEAQLKGAAPMTADPKKVRAWAAEQGYDVAPRTCARGRWAAMRAASASTASCWGSGSPGWPWATISAGCTACSSTPK